MSGCNRFLPILIVCLYCLSAYGQPEGYNITVIASDTGSESYPSYQWPALNEAGLVCYFGGDRYDEEAGTDETRGAILAGDGFVQAAIARSGTAEQFDRFLTRMCSINNAGLVAFDACRDCVPFAGPAYQTGIFTSAIGTSPTLVQGGGSAPLDFAAAVLPTINNGGAVAFVGRLNSGAQGVWISEGGTLSNSLTTGGKFSKIAAAFMNDAKNLVFAGSETGGEQGIYDGQEALLAGSSAGLTKLSFPVLNAASAIAFMAYRGGSGQDGAYLVYRGASPALQNGALYDRLPIDAFQAVGINDAGDVVLPAVKDERERAVLLTSSGETRVLIEAGASLPGFSSPIASLQVGRESINNRGQIALAIEFENGLNAVIRLDPVGLIIEKPTDYCPNNPAKLTPGICGCAESDDDSDGDRVPDCRDRCPADSRKIQPGVCGCGVMDKDRNRNGIKDCLFAEDLAATADVLQISFARLASAKKRGRRAARETLYHDLRQFLRTVRRGRPQIASVESRKKALRQALAVRRAVHAAVIRSDVTPFDKQVLTRRLGRLLRQMRRAG